MVWINTEKRKAASRANAIKASAIKKANGWYSSEKQSARRLGQIKSEEAEAEKLRSEGYDVYSPTVVCDRVAVKDGKVFFVEFKKTGQKLRPGQQRIFDLASEMYIVRYS